MSRQNRKASLSHASGGLLFVVSSPSGAGKTTLCHRLVEEFPQLSFSISYTTRPRRPSERDGKDYHFVDGAAFDRMIESGELAEWAEVHGNRYGTSKQTVVDSLERSRDVLFDIDWQGATRLKATYGDQAVMVFVLPPSWTELARRLRARRTEAEADVERRLAKAHEEMSHYGEYDYLLTNDELDRAHGELRAIYLAAHCTRTRRAHLATALLDQSRSDESG